MAHSHYVMDSYFSDGAGANGLRRETVRMDDLADDTAAIVEGKRIEGWKKPAFYEIRAIMTSTRSGDRLIHSSRTSGDAAIDTETPGEPVESPT
jgi:hypothetical protein